MLEKTVRDMFNGFTEEQKKVVYFLIGKASNKNFVETMYKELDQEIDKWKKATGCDTPEMAKEILGEFIQAASCAEKHLEHILLWRPEQTGQEVE